MHGSRRIPIGFHSVTVTVYLLQFDRFSPLATSRNSEAAVFLLLKLPDTHSTAQILSGCMPSLLSLLDLNRKAFRPTDL
ncbi:hypothetical protein CEXT_504311 [Caerostris extrusa]|uniref:Uncharacterized protein n=1 Tax=Caerostris extrusa TaxID=172846 RepID=A0AAV4SAX3_CAEEX|nr:hypothetical protein CEXT_504311 [Caerostris extrusa]